MKVAITKYCIKNIFYIFLTQFGKRKFNIGVNLSIRASLLPESANVVQKRGGSRILYTKPLNQPVMISENQ